MSKNMKINTLNRLIRKRRSLMWSLVSIIMIVLKIESK